MVCSGMCWTTHLPPVSPHVSAHDLLPLCFQLSRDQWSSKCLSHVIGLGVHVLLLKVLAGPEPLSCVPGMYIEQTS